MTVRTTNGKRGGYAVTPRQVVAAIGAEIQRHRDDIQAEIDELPLLYAERQAERQRQYEEAVERERQAKEKWDAEPYHFGNEWRPHTIFKPEFSPYTGPPAHLVAKRDVPAWELWCEYDLALFSGEDLTESQKQIWRRTIREMDADGLLERDGRRWLRLTEAGALLLDDETESKPKPSPELNKLLSEAVKTGEELEELLRQNNTERTH